MSKVMHRRETIYRLTLFTNSVNLYIEKLSCINDNQLARCGANVERFAFKIKPTVENMFSTGTDEALCDSTSFANQWLPKC